MDEAALGVGVVSSLVSFLMDTAPDVASHRNLVDRLLVSAQRAFTATRQLIGELRPEAVRPEFTFEQDVGIVDPWAFVDCSATLPLGVVRSEVVITHSASPGSRSRA